MPLMDGHQPKPSHLCFCFLSLSFVLFTRCKHLYVPTVTALRRARNRGVHVLPRHTDEPVDAECDECEHDEEHDDDDGDYVVLLHFVCFESCAAAACESRTDSGSARFEWEAGCLLLFLPSREQASKF
ncbi:hypothetical protein B0T17DRAFT_175559 [Bombardia bombarda]|uniref:Secreted protein n=1 Tax=Bombardia bombarda TaxID=252184 RepID=A0AA40C8N5_9PEZI|nr:hypothetical protein B0T17DRAFT_175559 [Bombardia bombarda]